MNNSEYAYNNKPLSYYPVFQKGLEQTRVIVELVGISKSILYNHTPTDTAIRKLYTYTSGYLNRRYPLEMDYCDSCEYRINRLKRLSPEAKEVCLSIICFIRQGKSAKEVLALITESSKRVETVSPIYENIINSKWIGEYCDKSYILDFELSSVVSLYEVNKNTLMPKTNISCGFGYDLESDAIKFKGGTHLSPTANFIKGELINGKLRIYYTTLSPYREWITKEIEFLPLSVEQLSAPLVVQNSENKISDLSPSKATSDYSRERVDCSINTPEFEYAPITVDDDKVLNVLKRVGLCLFALGGLALLIFILSKLMLLGFIILLGISMIFAKK